MRKTWTHKRPKDNGKGFYHYVKWIDEAGRERSKVLPNATLAKHYAQMKYQQLNSDVFTDAIATDWETVKKEYEASKNIQGLEQSSIYQALLTLQHFEKLYPIRTTKDLNQAIVEKFITSRLDTVGRFTVRKDIANLRAFITWLKENRYHQGNIKLNKVKADAPVFKLPTNEQIKAVIAACPDAEWRVRILLALCTGLRKVDVYELPAASINLEKGWIDTREQKTGKQYSFPLPDKLIPILKKHLETVPEGRHYLFSAYNDKNLDKIWREFRPFEITIQDFRRTNKTLLQKIGNISSVKDLIGHSDSKITEQFYTDNDLIMRWKINQLPIDQWL